MGQFGYGESIRSQECHQDGCEARLQVGALQSDQRPVPEEVVEAYEGECHGLLFHGQASFPGYFSIITGS